MVDLKRAVCWSSLHCQQWRSRSCLSAMSCKSLFLHHQSWLQWGCCVLTVSSVNVHGFGLKVTTGCILPIGYSVLLPWIQTLLPQKPEIVFDRVKELFEHIVLQKKKPGDRFLPFLKAFSWETDLRVTLGDFTIKMENWEGTSVFNWKSIKLK